jgi:hypothetical protein
MEDKVYELTEDQMLSLINTLSQPNKFACDIAIGFLEFLMEKNDE